MERATEMRYFLIALLVVCLPSVLAAQDSSAEKLVRARFEIEREVVAMLRAVTAPADAKKILNTLRDASNRDDACNTSLDRLRLSNDEYVRLVMKAGRQSNGQTITDEYARLAR